MMQQVAQRGTEASSAPRFKEFPVAELLPAGWEADHDVRIFNPTVLQDGGGFILFYRVVGQALGRRIAACRLDGRWQVVAGSVTAFSDHIAEVPGWHADPRLFALDGKTFLSWNDGIPPDTANMQHIVEIDPMTLRPLSRPARITRSGARRQVEKNWMLFDSGGCHAIYSIAPHRILEATITSSEWRFAPRARTFWNSAPSTAGFGEPRGGAQPVRRGDHFYHFCHAARKTAAGMRYQALVYEFDAGPPYRITRFARVPLPLPNPRHDTFRLPRLNDRVHSVVYPTGVVALERDGSPHWLIAYGVNDEAACLALVPHADVAALLEPVAARSLIGWQLRDKAAKLPGWLRRKWAAR